MTPLPNPPLPKLTAETIQALLEQVSSGAAIDHTALARLMEVYCVVKSGGVQVQVEAAQAHLAREAKPLEETMAPGDGASSCVAQDGQAQDSRHQVQELTELQKSVSWRLGLLQAITAEEEAAVAGALAEIEQRLFQPQPGRA